MTADRRSPLEVRVAEARLRELHEAHVITKSEAEILVLRERNVSWPDCAAILSRSESSLKERMRNARRKIGEHGRMEAA